jgi:hypothetical protein
MQRQSLSYDLTGDIVFYTVLYSCPRPFSLPRNTKDSRKGPSAGQWGRAPRDVHLFLQSIAH